MVAVERDALLPTDEGESASQLQHEFFQMVDERLLDLAFMPGFVLLEAEELQYVRVADDVLGLFGNGFAVGQGGERGLAEKTLVGAGVDLPFEFARAPVSLGAFFQVELTCIVVGDTHEHAIVRPAQFATQCVAFWEREEKLPHILQVGYGEPFAEIGRHALRQLLDQLRSILGALEPLLLRYDAFADMPVRLHHGEIRRRIGALASVRHDLVDVRVKRAVHQVSQAFVLGRFAGGVAVFCGVHAIPSLEWPVDDGGWGGICMDARGMRSAAFCLRARGFSGVLALVYRAAALSPSENAQCMQCTSYVLKSLIG